MSSVEHDKKAAKAEKRAAKEAKRANRALQAAAAAPAAAPPPPPDSFDAELAAMFSNAQPAYSSLDTSTQLASEQAPSHPQRTQRTRSAPHSSTQNTKRRKVRSEAEGERQVRAPSDGPWLSDTDSEESELQALSDDKAQQRRPQGDEGGKSDGEEGVSVELVHESILAARKSAKKGNKAAAHPSSAKGATTSELEVEAAGEDDGDSESARAIRDARTLFVGNIPLAVMSSKALRRKLLRHLQLCSPWPSRTLLEKLRFRSVPFAVPTGDYTAQNVEEANAKAKRRERARVWKHEREEGAGSAPAQKFLTPAQKRKVAFINEELNQQAHSVNAYVTIAMLDSEDADSPAASDYEKNLNAQGIAALTAHQADGTVFEGRHLRVDISAAIPASHRGGLPPTSPLGTPRSDVQDAPFTAFVGGLDYNADEEKLWTWFDLLLINEMGTPPAWEGLEDNKIWKRMPAPEPRATDGSGAGQSEVQKGEESDADTSDGSDEEDCGPTSKATHSNKTACPPAPQRGSSWVRSIRLVRDNATQLGKGFGYVRFASESCVDEVLALAAQDEAVLGSRHTGAGGGDRNAKASQARAAGVKEYRRKMKFEGRPIRVSKCKMTTKNSGAGRRAFDQKKQREELKRRRSVDGDAQESLSTPSRVRSAGAPTPGGSSPGQKKKSATVVDTPTQHRLSSSSKQVANPGPSIPYDAAKQARIEAKRKDPERLKRRAEKKEKKRAEEAQVRKLRDVLGDEADGKRKGKVKIMPFKNTFKPSVLHLAASASNKRVRSSLGSTLQRAHLMATGVLCIVALCLVQRVSANTEIENFGPLLCRADAVGLLSDHAARKVARGWPILVPASTPSRFTIPAVARQDASADRGAWIVLQLTRAAHDSRWRDEQTGSGEEEEAKAIHQENIRAGKGTSSAESQADAAQVVRPTELASDELPLIDQAKQAEVSPRDRFLTHIWHKVAWTLSKRYQLRLSWSASFPAKFWVEVYTPEGMLEAGGISWQAAQEEGPSNDTDAVRSDRAAQASRASPQPRTASGRGGVAQPTGTPQPAQPEGPTVISQADARTPPEAYAQTGGEAPALWPCPRVYARIRAVHDGTPIPVMASNPPSILVRLAQAYLGALGPGEHQDGSRQAALHSSNVPIHLILEPLDLALVPHTALSLLALLLPIMAIAWTICVPLALAACTAVLRCAVQRDLHVKAE